MPYRHMTCSKGAPGRIGELDGLRGAAAIMVVVAHYFGETPHGVAALTWGWLAVGVFFVLSGFLIGSIILEQGHETGFVTRFYLRRAARIVPAYAIAIAAGFGMIWLFRGRPWCDHALPAISYLTFTQNFAIAAGMDGGRWLLPTWTLAVEEQFYLLIPLLILIVPRRWLGGVLVALLLCAGLFRWACFDAHTMAALVLLPSRMDMLLSGVIAALMQKRFRLAHHLFKLRLVPLVAAIALLAVALWDRNRLFAILAPTLLGVGTASFLLAMVHGAPEGARFRAPLLIAAGRISYALYLFHQPVAGLVHGILFDTVPDIDGVPRILASLLAFGIAIGLAWLSCVFVERPAIDGMRRWCDRLACQKTAAPAIREACPDRR